MTGYRADLPQLKPGLFVSDGGMETTLIFHEGVELPHFASFVLLDSEEGRARLRAYYERYLAIARRHRRGLILDSPTWRANPDWGAKIGYDAAGLKRINEASIALLDELRQAWETAQTPIVVAGVLGPRGDGYAEGRMSAVEAEDYHAPQIASFAQTAADMVAAYTLNYVEEAIGIARAARALAMPCSISFTVETDGNLIGGRSLRDAVETVDRETDAAPAYYMINCAHPAHFEQALSADAPWMNRLLGIKANASTKSHAELDESETLDSGDPVDLGRRYRKLRATYPGLRILGGCCGTDDRHVAAICEACA
ncbi:homocysteine S-methyltransferase family protein [Methylocystis sp.]|uniref:homocysteine S-methyltransferase family protein n=1 Tax=Methylocystis sp. TaxID=1911079 RepID=UPI0027326361|nr:homocysteine S-methyltransferase family protein [Methylocystis sp.]MDP3554756.1 homocysteine S-methyltransferase family protein [Methylocystis sp.]